MGQTTKHSSAPETLNEAERSNIFVMLTFKRSLLGLPLPLAKQLVLANQASGLELEPQGKLKRTWSADLVDWAEPAQASAQHLG